MKKWVRDIWLDYKSEVFFGFVMVALVVLSSYLAQFIPDDLYDHVLTPTFNVCTFAVSFSGAWFIFRHVENVRIRHIWGCALLTWGLGDLAYLVCNVFAPMQVMNMGADHITAYELLIGNLLGWVMVLYPTETLRPGWLTWKAIGWQLLPMVALVALDYVVPFSLRLLIALYPYALLALVFTHIRKYRQWCEDNFSTLDNIDVQWIIRYCIMLVLIGLNYVNICVAHDHTRGFTQQWFVVFVLVYCTEQILYRPDPWTKLRHMEEEENNPTAEGGLTAERSFSDNGLTGTNSAVLKLEQWIEREKPYLNPDFQLTDLRQVLPMNRTYLSQFIKNAYGCSFYQWVNGLRIREAKRIMTEQPEMKMQDVAKQSGFSSPTVFSRTFSRKMGQTPSVWLSAQSK